MKVPCTMLARYGADAVFVRALLAGCIVVAAIAASAIIAFHSVASSRFPVPMGGDHRPAAGPSLSESSSQRERTRPSRAKAVFDAFGEAACRRSGIVYSSRPA